MRLSRAVGIVWAVAGLGATAVRAQTAPTAIERVSVVDVAAGRVVPDRTVLLDGGRIVSVGHADSMTVGAGMQRVDGRGRFLIPGLWDMHVHATRPGRAERYFLLYLAHGVTGVRDMGPLAAYTDSSVVWAARSQSRDVDGPRLISSSPILDDYVGDDARAKIAVKTPEAAAQIVDSLAGVGVAGIKVYSLVRPEVLAAVVSRARAHGLPVAGHASFLIGVRGSADVGVRSLEHLIEFDVECSAKGDSLRAAARAEYLAAAVAGPAVPLAVVERHYPLLLETFDAARCQDVGRDLARRGVWVTPTLAHRMVVAGQLWLDSVPGRADVRRLLPAREQADWDRASAAGGFPNRVARYRRLEGELQLPIMRALHGGGVRWLAGTDIGDGSGREHSAPGVSLHDELGALVRAGLTPAEALRAATLEPAAYLGRERDAGQVLPGMAADLVLLDANPLAAIDNTRRIHSVIVGGRVYGPAAVAALLARAEALARAADQPR